MRRQIQWFMVLVVVTVVGGWPIAAGGFSLTQRFDKAADSYHAVDDAAWPEAVQRVDFTTTPTGWAWGGFATTSPNLSCRIEVDRIALHSIPTSDVLIFKSMTPQSYAYTIFSSSGGFTPDAAIDLSQPGASLELEVADSWNGWFGGGDNGSGLPAPANQVRATVLRLMVRDANGEWYVSELFPLHTVEDYSLDSVTTPPRFNHPLDGMSWYPADPNTNNELNLMADGDETSLDYAAVPGNPDLSVVGGMGLLVWSCFDSTLGQLAVTEMTLNGAEATIEPPYSLTQNFAKEADTYHRIADGALPESPQWVDYTTTPTGWRWGGYADPDRLCRIEVDRIGLHAIPASDMLIWKNPPKNSYAYTIFSGNGDGTPTQYIDLGAPNATLELEVADSWNGWFGGGDNGSGLPEPANEDRATVLRLMIRDGDGAWYVSDVFALHTIEDYSLDAKTTPTRFTYPLHDKSWYAVDAAVSDNLNLLQGNDAVPLTYAETAGSPDLGFVSGAGILVWHGYESTLGALGLTEIKLLGGEAAALFTCDLRDWPALSSDWMRSTITWDNSMDIDPITEGWEARGGIPGDYTISGGRMVISGNAGAWRIDTVPQNGFPGVTTLQTSLRSTSTSSTAVGARSGVGLWLNVDNRTDLGTYGALNFHVVLEPDNTQYVEFISDWTDGVGWPPAAYLRVAGDGTTDFNDGLLDVDLTLDPNEAEVVVDYVISDPVGTTATGSFTMTRRTGSATGFEVATILTGGATGEIDSFFMQGNYTPMNDINGDNIIDFQELAWFINRWLAPLTEPCWTP